MPARILIAHDEPEFLDQASAALRSAGHEVVTFSGSMEALRFLEAAQAVELLITRVGFPPGTPNGVSLALMARRQRRGIKVIFTARPDREEFTEGLGELVPHPVSIPALVDAANRLLDRPAEPPEPAAG